MGQIDTGFEIEMGKGRNRACIKPIEIRRVHRCKSFTLRREGQQRNDACDGVWQACCKTLINTKTFILTASQPEEKWWLLPKWLIIPV